MEDIRNCKVIVTGGAGFLGSHLVDHLVEDRGCEVLVLDNLVAGHRKFVNKKAHFQWCDITHSEDEMLHIFKDFGVDYIFQYAAMPYIPDSFKRPVHVAEINAMGALKVIQAAQEAGAKKILQVSSAEIYGKMDGKKNEDTPIEPHSTYGVAKVFADGMVQVRAREAQCPVIAMRQFNCYGPRETHPYVIPEIISQLSRGNHISLGNNSFRDFQYARDAVRMAVELLEKGTPGQVYNMGSESGIRIYDLAQMIGKLMGHDEVVIHPDEKRMRPWEIWHLQSDNTKLFRTISARPETLFVQGLAETIQYFETNGGWDFN